MKRKKTILVVALVMLFLIGTISAGATQNNSLLLKNAQQANLASKIQEKIEEESYPDYFGGIYISDDSSHVVLQIVKDKIPKSKSSIEYTTFKNVSEMDSDIEIEYVDNSYKDLNDINNKLIEYFSSENADISNLNAHYIDVIKNQVVIELKSVEADKIHMVKEKAFDTNTISKMDVNSSLIKIVQKDSSNNDFALKAGQQISVTHGSCSMGFRVKVNGEKGYITAAHCFDKKGDSSTGGKVEWWKYGGKVDAAFVKKGALNIFSDPSNELKYTSGDIKELNASVSAIPSVNMTIAKAGFKTGYTTGKIKSTNYSGVYEGTYFTGLIASDMHAAGGDSGGPVFIPMNINGGATLLGIIKGSSSYGSSFVSVDNIFAELPYVRY